MKLLIQIPCMNERDQLARTVAELPRRIPGILSIEVVIVDDGSTDGTSEVAEFLGVHHIVRFRKRRGLAAAYVAGLDACLGLGADIIVNTDADNQYRGDEIARLVEPIFAGRADVVIGDRDTDRMAGFSPCKRWLQRWGSRLVCRAAGLKVRDCTSGFRAFSRKAALQVFVHNRFSYTLESLIQAGMAGLAVETVRVHTNPAVRPSRLFRSIPDYLCRIGPTIFRAYAMYRPVQTFGSVALLLLMLGVALIGRFLWYYAGNPGVSGHTQSLLLGVGSVILAFIVGLVALLGDLIAANRRLTEEVLVRVRRLEGGRRRRTRRWRQASDIYSTGVEPWKNPLQTVPHVPELTRSPG